MKSFTLAILAWWLLPLVPISQVQNHSFEYDGHTRDYIVFLPQGYNGSTPFPAVINLHGYNHTAEGQMEFSGMNPVADTASFIVVYPQALEGRWNSGIGDNPNWPTPNVDDVGFLDALIDTLAQQYLVDMERIYACGVSNGGFMSLKLACQLGDRLAAVASVAGVVSSTTGAFCNADYPMPVLYFHGTADNIIPYNGGETGWYSAESTLEFWTDINDCSEADTVQMPNLDPLDGCTVEKITFNCDDVSGVTFFKILNGGHTWPSSAFTFDPGIVGNTTYDINASEEIWNFFKDYYLTTTDIEGDPMMEDKVCLRVYPNPVAGRSVIQIFMEEEGYIQLELFNTSGKLVKRLLSTNLPEGNQQLLWPGTELPAGMYFLVMTSGNRALTERLILGR